MKPAAFTYHAPASLDEVVALLDTNPGAKILAGGQSLVPMMNFRLARPPVLIDINRVADLDYVRIDDGALEVGALARHRRFEAPVVPGPLGQSLATVARHVGHHPIRIRGTFVGSIAHADPASEWCVVVATLDAQMVARSVNGTRSIAAADFFHTMFSTDLADNEMLSAVKIPQLASSERIGFAEFARRAGDFALVMSYAVINVVDGVITKARIGLGGVSDRPLRVPEAEAALAGQPATTESASIAAGVAADVITPLGDIHGSPEYRRDLVRAMVRRSVTQAIES